MNLSLDFNTQDYSSYQVVVLSAFSKSTGEGKKKQTEMVNTHWPKEYKDLWKGLKSKGSFNGTCDSQKVLTNENGQTVIVWGLGEKSKLSYESLRKSAAKLYKALQSDYKEVTISFDGLVVKSKYEESLTAFGEAIHMTAYSFDRYKTDAKAAVLKSMTLATKEKKVKAKKFQAALDKAQTIGECVNYARDLVNEPPNVLNSVTYAKEVEKDAKKIKGVKVKVLGKAELKKEKMGMFLSVNAGSAHEPRLVHLTYTPSKVTKNTKHIALVGKGLTFDTGGYSLKPGGSMVNMKFDMAGSATMYGAFRAIAMLGVDVKVSCYLGMTDNAVNEHATMPDSIVTARNGKTVEILNTDAEGRLVLGDVLSYASDQKPDALIDAATLTGACLVSLGTEVCGLMGNDKKLAEQLLKAATNCDEYMWELPIIPEFREDMKSPIADLKNIGGSRFGGTSKAAAFLENFVGEDIKWAHLDIAGIGDGQSHLPYCPAKGASGLVVRTLVNYIDNA